MNYIKEWKSDKLNDVYRLIFSGEGIERFRTKEQAKAYYIENETGYVLNVKTGEYEYLDDSDEMNFEDSYECNNYAVFNGENGNIVILNSYCFEDNDDESLTDFEDLIDFTEDCLSDELNSNSNVILYVSQCFGTTTDHTIIFDDCLFDEINKSDNGLKIIGLVQDYIYRAAQQDKEHSWKYAKIIDGEYSKY